MAFIRKRSGKNGVSFHLYDKEGDFQIAKKIPVDNLRDAKEYLGQYLGEKVNGKPSSLMVKEMSLSKLVEKYLEYSRHLKTANSFGKDMYTVTLLLNEFGRFPLMEITKQMIESKQNKWKDQGRANKTINNRTILLGTILNYALDNEYVPFTPKVKKFKVDKKRPIIFSDEDVTRIFSTATGLLRDYLVVFFHTGCRLSEIRFLKWVEINFDRRELYIEKSKSHTYRVIQIGRAHV